MLPPLVDGRARASPTVDAVTRVAAHRLRHQLDPAARRRCLRRRAGRRGRDGWRWCASARASTAPGRSRAEALERTFARSQTTPRASRPLGRRARPHGGHSRRPATRPTATTSSTACTRSARRPRPRSITGDEEARLSFLGAPAGLPRERRQWPRRSWSSTSAVGRPSSCSAADAVTAARSVDIGCVRMTERHLPADPPTPRQVEAAEAGSSTPRSSAARGTVPLGEAATLVAVAGSVTTVAAIALGLEAYDPTDPRLGPDRRAGARGGRPDCWP